MSDFVAEVLGPRSFVNHSYAPVYSPGEFVAEVGPRREENSPLRNQNSCGDFEIPNEDLLQTVLTDSISTDNITRILERSILELIERVLRNRVDISRIEGGLRISLFSHESPILMNLNKTFAKLPSNDNMASPSLETAFNVKMKSADTPTSCLNEGSCEAVSPFQEFDRDPCHALGDGDNKSLSPLEFYRDRESFVSSPPDVLSSGLDSPREEMEAATRFQPVLSPVLEAVMEVHRSKKSEDDDDDESGYTSNDKEESDTACEHSVCRSKSCPQKAFSPFNDYYCNGFDGKNTLYTSQDKHSTMLTRQKNTQTFRGSSRCKCGDIDNDDVEVEMEHRLVIDESPKQNMKSADVTKDMGTKALKLNKGNTQEVLHQNRTDKICLSDESEDADSPLSSDITDTDIPVDTCGDSRLSSDVTSAVPHPQSFVFKHPGGFMCKQCSIVLPDAEAVSSHFKSTHNLYCCTFCCGTFTAKNNLKRHIRIHTGYRPYKCTMCPQSFARRDDLKGHMLRHDYTKPYRCFLCKKGYTDRACVKNHMAKEHGSRLMHVCPQCGESYDQEEAFALHKKTHIELQQFSCDICPFIGTNHLMTQKHYLLHTHKLFSCKPCNAYFADPFDYTNHIRQHKKLSSFSQYVCCFCDVVFPTYDQYVRHEYTHTQAKTHVCKTCKKQFKTKSLLQEHANIHLMHGMDKARIEELEASKNLEIKEFQAVDVQEQEDQEMDSTFTDDYNNRPCDLNLPDLETCQSTPEENNCEEFEGELLDLSLKNTSSRNNTSNDSCSFSFCPTLNGPAEINFPRNGEDSSESFNLSQNCEVTRSPLMPNQETGNAFFLNKKVNTSAIYQVDSQLQRKANAVFQVQNVGNDKSSLRNHWWDSIKEPKVSCSSFETITKGMTDDCPVRPPSDERIWFAKNSQIPKSESRQLQRAEVVPPLRFNPYSRNKLADLAAKFVAARGTQLFEQRRPKKIIIPDWENARQGTVINRVSEREIVPVVIEPKWQCPPMRNIKAEYENNPLLLKSNHAQEKIGQSCHTRNNFDEILREETNPETASKYRVLGFVKNEPLFEHDSETDYNCSLAKTTPEKLNCFSNHLNAMDGSPLISYNCEDCKEEFATFLELENHSLDIHKRYLCEHCRKSFTARPNRDRHVRYHTGERPYKCDLCDLAFFRGDDLKYHRTTRHPQAPPFVCRRCSASFTWGRDLERHIRHSKCKP